MQSYSSSKTDDPNTTYYIDDINELIPGLYIGDYAASESKKVLRTFKI
jgi:hypothetical protein